MQIGNTAAESTKYSGYDEFRIKPDLFFAIERPQRSSLMLALLKRTTLTAIYTYEKTSLEFFPLKSLFFTFEYLNTQYSLIRRFRYRFIKIHVYKSFTINQKGFLIPFSTHRSFVNETYDCKRW